MNEHIWQKAEANQTMRERRRLLKKGTIRTTSVPNILVKSDNGDWKLPMISTR